MCELLAMSSRAPATVRLSLEELARRGGSNGRHRDGWGIAYYVDRDVRLLKDAEPMADSACVRFVQEHPFRTSIAMAHIRHATQGATLLRNCQPFVRELGGAMHVFAHNGNLDMKSPAVRLRLGAHRPVGETDSEHAFCALLARLGELWRSGALPTLAERLAVVTGFAADLRLLGPANFLYADGDALFAHGHARMQGVEGIRPPGLHVLCRSCAAEPSELDATSVSIEGPRADEQHVVLFASVPLTPESGWRPLAAGEIVVARAGVVASVT